MAEGININEEDVQKENVPDDLNSLAVGSYVIPNPLRRRRFAHLVLLSSIIALALNFFLELGNLVPSSINVLRFAPCPYAPSKEIERMMRSSPFLMSGWSQTAQI